MGLCFDLRGVHGVGTLIFHMAKRVINFIFNFMFEDVFFIPYTRQVHLKAVNITSNIHKFYATNILSLAPFSRLL